MKKKTSPEPKQHGSRPALLVIDIQKGLFEKSTPVYAADRLLANLCALIERARQAGAPVVFVQHENESFLAPGSAGWELHPALQAMQPDVLIHKRHGSSFEETGLEEELESREVGALVITGLVSHGCVKATSLGALELGYRVILVEDGHSNYHKQAASMIEEWNQKLSSEGAQLVPAAEVDFLALGAG